MKRILSLLSASVLLLQFLVSMAPATAATSAHYTKSICPAVSVGRVHCFAHVTTDKDGHPLVTKSYSTGLTPADLRNAYKLPATNGAFAWNGQTIAIVDAYNNPNTASDLVAYRTQFGLPLCTGGTVDCLLTKVNGSGGTTLPSSSISWGQEISLDVQMVAAVCPQCKILLVEANSPTMAGLATAVDTAVNLGATAVSNSYGGSEFSNETSQESHYNHPGVAIVAAAGDSGYGVEYPAASQYVTAVGGTTLTKSTNARGWTETAWSGSGSGCSRYIAKPTWQTAVGICGKRMVADVAAVADPKTGVAVYDSYGSGTRGNWFVFGGTSAATPIIAATYGLAKVSNHTGFTYGELPYAHAGNLFDVTTGKNGYCSTSLKALCTAGSGYDGPTGLGTPNGLGAF